MMKRARVAFAGAVHDAREHDGRVQLADGRLLDELDVVWLPPFEVGTIFALGLNYVEHRRELHFTAEPAPLVFLKGPNAVAGHRAQTQRPRDVTMMHYECELAVVIGRYGARIPRSRAEDHIAGYCVANDYVPRDYLENYYRPNLRAKSRDGATLLGPWLVDAGDVDRDDLTLRTTVNGVVRRRAAPATWCSTCPRSSSTSAA
jgi:5-oxopent-3-ene-1,2,5-tricarboxylate decarboxylase/2-hydroxyhepta-2,4-diene-1,7-dioate isomerase